MSIHVQLMTIMTFFEDDDDEHDHDDENVCDHDDNGDVN